jgi:hypothetical protein
MELDIVAMHCEGWVLRPSIYGWVLSVTARVLYASSSPVKFASVSTANGLFWVFSCLCVVYSSCFSNTVCVCITQILLEFLLARC